MLSFWLECLYMSWPFLTKPFKLCGLALKFQDIVWPNPCAAWYSVCYKTIRPKQNWNISHFLMFCFVKKKKSHPLVDANSQYLYYQHFPNSFLFAHFWKEFSHTYPSRLRTLQMPRQSTPNIIRNVAILWRYHKIPFLWTDVGWIYKLYWKWCYLI